MIPLLEHIYIIQSASNDFNQLLVITTIRRDLEIFKFTYLDDDSRIICRAKKREYGSTKVEEFLLRM